MEFIGRETLEQALSYSTADHCEVMAGGFAQGATRFANNAITQNMAKSNRELTVRVMFDQKTGQSSVNDLSVDGIRAAVERAEAIAKESEPDPEALPPPEPESFESSPAWSDATARMTPDDRAAAIRDALEAGKKDGLSAAGSYTATAETFEVANNRGLYASHRSSQAKFVVTALSPDSSGWAESVDSDASRVSALDAARRAAEKANAARNPASIDPGAYTVVLEPSAAAEMLAFLAFSLDARAADEGRSAFSGKEGADLFHPSVTIRSDPRSDAVPADPIFDNGIPVPAVTWIDGGRLNTLSYSRFWAKEKNRPYNGSPGNLLMDGGDASLDELIGSVRRGVLVTRFWYIRFVDPMSLLLTGMTRDGLFLIEDGRISKGLRNMRFNESPIRMLQNVAALGRPEPTGGYLRASVPPVVVDDFRFTSSTSF